jgi:hypothetical protein
VALFLCRRREKRGKYNLQFQWRNHFNFKLFQIARC